MTKPKYTHTHTHNSNSGRERILLTEELGNSWIIYLHWKNKDHWSMSTGAVQYCFVITETSWV